MAAQAIGIVSQAQGTVTAVNSEGYERTLQAGDQIFDGDVVATQGKESSVDITFNNGCTMALSGDETALIDETVYKLEFFEDAEVVVDLEKGIGISQDVSQDDEEEVDEIYLADADSEADDIEDIDLDEIQETAAGSSGEISQVQEGEIEQRVQLEETEQQSGVVSQEQESGSGFSGVNVTEVERGGEVVTSTVSFSVLNINSSGFLNGSPVISGQAPAGSSVELFDYGNSIIAITVDSSGTFTLQPDLEDGTHSLTAQLTVDGVTGNPTDPILFTIDSVAPEMALIQSSDLTNTTTPLLSGSAEPLSHLTITVADQTYSVVADASGAWKLLLQPLADGRHDLSITVTDQAGNTSETLNTSLSVDTTLPDNPLIDSLAQTNDTTPSISGHAEAGGKVTIYLDGTAVGETTADAQGLWSFTLDEQGDGSYNISATVTDSAGNVSGSSAAQTLIIDTVEPEVTVEVMPDITNSSTPVISGTAQFGDTVTIVVGTASFTTAVTQDGSWSITLEGLGDGTHDVVVTVKDSAGNVSDPVSGSIIIDQTAPDAPMVQNIAIQDGVATITGSSEADSTVSVSVADHTYEVKADAQGLWSVTTQTLGDGSYDVSAVAVDRAGNSSGSSMVHTFVVDATPPAPPEIDDVDISLTGVVHISGSAETGSTVSIEVGGHNYSVQSSDGTWSLLTDALQDGSYVIEVTATDAAGNSSGTVTASIILDDSLVTASVNFSGNTQGSLHTIESATLYGLTTEDYFDPQATHLDLSAATFDAVATHNKGYGIEGGYQGTGDKKAIGSDEALVIQLNASVTQLEVQINKLHFYEGGYWIAYDSNMQQVGASSFGFFDTLLGRNDGYESSLWNNSGVVTIDSESVDAAFEYIVFTTDESFQGKISSYFVEDISYETIDGYIYELRLEHVPMSDMDTTLYIEGLGQNISLEDDKGNKVGSFESDIWVLHEDDIQSLGRLDGSLDLKIISEGELDVNSLQPTVTVVETSLEGIDLSGLTTLSPLIETDTLIDFDNVEEALRIDLSEDEINTNGLNLHDVLQLGSSSNSLKIVSGEDDEHVLRLDAADWQVKTDGLGNEVSVEQGDNSYTVYTSTSAEHEYDLFIDEMITIVLEN